MVGNEEVINGKEEKSWINLFSKYYGGTHIDTSYTGTNIDTHLLSSVFTFFRSGYYGWDNGNLIVRSGNGYYWSVYANSNTGAYNLGFLSTYLNYRRGDFKGHGMSLR